jgi:hypothetical protein
VGWDKKVGQTRKDHIERGSQEGALPIQLSLSILETGKSGKKKEKMRAY